MLEIALPLIGPSCALVLLQTAQNAGFFWFLFSSFSVSAAGESSFYLRFPSWQGSSWISPFNSSGISPVVSFGYVSCAGNEVLKRLRVFLCLVLLYFFLLFSSSIFSLRGLT